VQQRAPPVPQRPGDGPGPSASRAPVKPIDKLRDRHKLTDRCRLAETLTDLASELGEHATAGTALDAAERGNIVIVTIPLHSIARELFRRVAVSVGLNNTDDHLRNHGFLHGRGGWSLSPAFDVNPNPNPEMRQTAIAGADLPADQAEGLKELARLCRLSHDEARTILSEVAEAIADWRDAARRNDITTAEFGRFEDSFSTGLQPLRSV